MTFYLKTLNVLTDARSHKVTDYSGYRAAVRSAWNAWDDLSPDGQRHVVRPDGN